MKAENFQAIIFLVLLLSHLSKIVASSPVFYSVDTILFWILRALPFPARPLKMHNLFIVPYFLGKTGHLTSVSHRNGVLS